MSEAANGRFGGGAPVGSATGTVASAEAGQSLHPWNKRKGRGEPCLQSPLAVALSEARGVPGPYKDGETTKAFDEQAARRPRNGLLSAPPNAATWEHFAVGSAGDRPAPRQADPRRRHTSVDLKPGLKSL